MNEFLAINTLPKEEQLAIRLWNERLLAGWPELPEDKLNIWRKAELLLEIGILISHQYPAIKSDAPRCRAAGEEARMLHRRYHAIKEPGAVGWSASRV